VASRASAPELPGGHLIEEGIGFCLKHLLPELGMRAPDDRVNRPADHRAD